MESHVCIGDERIAAPKFAIGEPVVSVFDEESEDDLDPRPRTFEWWRGIVTGCYYVRASDRRYTCVEPGWVYHVRVIASYEARGAGRWNREPEAFHESELKPSSYTPRYFGSQANDPNVGVTVGPIA